MARYIKSFSGNTLSASVYTVPAGRTAKLLGSCKMGGWNDAGGTRSYVEVNSTFYSGTYATTSYSYQVPLIMFNEGGMFPAAMAMYGSSIQIIPNYCNYGPLYLATGSVVSVYSNFQNMMYNFVVIEEDIT